MEAKAKEKAKADFKEIVLHVEDLGIAKMSAQIKEKERETKVAVEKGTKDLNRIMGIGKAVAEKDLEDLGTL